MDCTSGFTSNKLFNVTILVGLTYKGKPICGFIGHPFKKDGQKNVFEPRVYIGSTESADGCAFEL